MITQLDMEGEGRGGREGGRGGGAGPWHLKCQPDEMACEVASTVVVLVCRCRWTRAHAPAHTHSRGVWTLAHTNSDTPRMCGPTHTQGCTSVHTLLIHTLCGLHLDRISSAKQTGLPQQSQSKHYFNLYFNLIRFFGREFRNDWLFTVIQFPLLFRITKNAQL